MISICKIFEFHAAHRLSDHDGKCKNLHGHTYKLEIEMRMCRGYLEVHGPSKGMVMDFKHLSNWINTKIIDKVDHQCLNDIAPFDEEPPTTENILRFLVVPVLQDGEGNSEGIYIPIRARLWESSTSYAEWKREEVPANE